LDKSGVLAKIASSISKTENPMDPLGDRTVSLDLSVLSS